MGKQMEERKEGKKGEEENEGRREGRNKGQIIVLVYAGPLLRQGTFTDAGYTHETPSYYSNAENFS